jgi:hypothetical protein
MKTNKLRILGFVLVILIGGVLMVCTNIQEDRPIPALQTATELGSGDAMPMPTSCDYQGKVVKLAGVEDICNLNILLDNGELLYPNSMLVEFDFEVGQRVEVSYEQQDVIVPNCKGIPVTITCAKLLPENPPPDACIHNGRIVDLGIDEYPYNINIRLQDGTLLFPKEMKTEFVMKDGQFVALGFEKIYQPVVDEIPGTPVVVTCMRLRSPEPDEDLKPVDYNGVH